MTASRGRSVVFGLLALAVVSDVLDFFVAQDGSVTRHMLRLTASLAIIAAMVLLRTTGGNR